jgi:hypothetical protein
MKRDGCGCSLCIYAWSACEGNEILMPLEWYMHVVNASEGR